MADGMDANTAISQVFNHEWVQDLKDKNVFSGEVEEWRITQDNITEVLRAISVNAAHYKMLLTQLIKSSPNNSIGYVEMTNVFRDELS